MAKRTDFTVKEKTPVFGKKPNKDGTRRRVGTTVTYADGEKQTLLTPTGKGAKYAAELKNGRRYTNDMKYVKTDENGKPLGLSKAQRAFRSGYLQSQKDSSKAYTARELKKMAKAQAKAEKAQKTRKAHGDSRGEDMGIERYL